MNLTLLQDAAAGDEPVTVTEAKAYLNLSISNDDTMIQGLITAARIQGEIWSHRELAKKRYLLALDQFPTARGVYLRSTWSEAGVFGFSPDLVGQAGAIGLLDPLLAVNKVAYITSDGVTHELAATTGYFLDIYKHPAILLPPYNQTWPGDTLQPSSGVQVTFMAGYAPADCPQSYKQGMLLLINQWYESRIPFEAIRFVAQVPFSVAHLFGGDPIWRL